jgi:vacuolar-type H+-ATPase subunit I/STV1
MNSKHVMTTSALFLMAAGILLSFAPKELSPYFPVPVDPLVLQLAGALYFAFGMVNWTAREALIGGIYGRPVLIGNVTHFVIGALTLVKNILSGGSEPLWLAAAVVYTSFAMQFSVLFFRQPKQKN